MVWLNRLLVLLVLLSGVASAAEQITLSQSTSAQSIDYDDSLILRIELKWNGPQTAYRFPPLTPRLDRLRVESFSTSVSTEIEAGTEVTHKRFSYTLVPTSGGTGRIEPITIDYLHYPDSIPGQLMTEAIMVQIGQPPDRPAPEKSPTLIPQPVMIALLIVLALSIAFVVLLVVRSRRPKAPVMTAEEELLQKLGELKQDVGNDVKRFQTGVYKLLVAYLASRYRMSLAGMTTEEMVQIIDQSDMPTLQKEKIGAWMIQAQRQKFAPAESAPGEVQRLETEIRALFDKAAT